MNDTYKLKMNTLLMQWNVQINQIYIMAVNAEADAKQKYVEQLDVLHTKRREATKMIKELENASGDSREQNELHSVKTGIIMETA